MEFLIILVIVFFYLRKDNKSHNYRTRRTKKKQKSNQLHWQSEWLWDEEKQLWVHPLSGDTPLQCQPGKPEG